MTEKFVTAPTGACRTSALLGGVAHRERRTDMSKSKTKRKAKITTCGPDTALPSERTYCGEDHHFRGVMVQPKFPNEEHITKAHVRLLWGLVDDVRRERVQTKEIVIMLLDCAVDLTATYCTSEVMAYRPFVEAVADLSNHFGAIGLCDDDDAW